MAVFQRSYLTLCATVGAAALCAALVTSPASAGSGPAGGCTATASIGSQWGSGPTGGQVATVTVTNTSAVRSATWTVGWTIPAGQRFAAVWNATASASGNEVGFTNNVYNGSLAPGASALFGVRLEGVAPAPELRCDNGVPVQPSSSSGSGPTVTYADNGRTLGVVVGSTLAVSLGAEFRPPTVSNPILTQLSSSGGYPTGQPLQVLYRVAAAGRTDTTTQTDAPCFYTSPPCARPVQQWVVHVVAIG